MTYIITVYGGLLIFICGTIGNLLNICGLWQNRQNSCGFIFLVFSFNNILGLFYGLFPRILTIGFNQDWSIQNLVWCKARVALSQTFAFISLSCICFASIDRLFASSHQLKFRRISRLPTAKWITFAIILFWLLHSIPYLVFSSIIKVPETDVPLCSILPNVAFEFYRKYIVFPIYVGLLPTGILITTGLLTYYNTTKLRIHRQRQAIQKQLTLMMLVQIPIIVISTLPYAVFMEYILLAINISKSTNQRNIETILTNTLNLVFYIGFGCQCFVFLLSSRIYREQIKNIVLCSKQMGRDKNTSAPVAHDPIRTREAMTHRTKKLHEHKF